MKYFDEILTLLLCCYAFNQLLEITGSSNGTVMPQVVMPH